jgi:hypothetical protein
MKRKILKKPRITQEDFLQSCSNAKFSEFFEEISTPIWKCINRIGVISPQEGWFQWVGGSLL